MPGRATPRAGRGSEFGLGRLRTPAPKSGELQREPPAPPSQGNRAMPPARQMFHAQEETMTFAKRMIRLRRSLGHVFAFGALAILLLGATASAQAPGGDGRQATPDLREAIVDSVTATLNESYVFEDVALDMEERLRSRLEAGDYDEHDTVAGFARALAQDLRDVSGDRHLGLRYMSDDMMAEFMDDEDDPELERQREHDRLVKENFYFRKAEILEGNVGYLRFDQFPRASLAGPTATAAVNFVAHTDALVIDLRHNGGGSPSLIQYIMAYLLDEPTHLNSFHTRQGDSIQQFWSAPYVPGPTMEDVDLYVLTSSNTFSGAEEFTYNVKNLERGTIVGETTGGGAHPLSFKVFPSLNVGLAVPYARAVNPVSGTNWEGTGITPDIEVPAVDALERAYLEALTAILEDKDDEEERFSIQWVIDGLETKLEPVEVSESKLDSYAGQYGPRRLWVDGGQLLYQREDGPVMAAMPMSQTLFRFEGLDYFRLEVVTDGSGVPVKLVGHYESGHMDESARTDE
ncbi:MAG: hypothetical protein GF400_01880 [Candidatus Eisenbacteria bacterium]|nr:hypothetical protein [Candidatus Eisenbacteria bacterium]